MSACNDSRFTLYGFWLFNLCIAYSSASLKCLLNATISILYSFYSVSRILTFIFNLPFKSRHKKKIALAAQKFQWLNGCWVPNICVCTVRPVNEQKQRKKNKQKMKKKKIANKESAIRFIFFLSKI